MIWRTQWSKLLICVRNIHHGRGGHESIFQIHISIQLMRSFNFFSDILRPHGVALRAPPRLLGRPKEHRPPPHPDDGNHRIREGGPGTHHLTMASNVKDFNPLERLQSISQIIAKYQKNLLLKLFLLVKVRTSSYKLRLLYEPKKTFITEKCNVGSIAGDPFRRRRRYPTRVRGPLQGQGADPDAHRSDSHGRRPRHSRF